MGQLSKKSIAIIASMYGYGGIERSLINLLKNIPPNRYDMTVGIITPAGELVKEIPNWITVKEIPRIGKVECVRRLFLKGRLLKILEYIARGLSFKLFKKPLSFNLRQTMVSCLPSFEGSYDVAISWSLPDNNENIYVLEKVSAVQKYMWIHMDLNHYKMPIDSDSYIGRFDKIVCVSVSCKKAFDARYPFLKNKSMVCYNVLDVNSIRERANQNVEFAFSPNRFSILTCGRLNSEKNLFVALDVCACLTEQGIDDFTWYFVGDGSLKSALQAEVEKRNLGKYIVFLGMKTNPYPYMAGVDIYVQMSRHESFCLALAEAQILGVPAVSTNFPSACEIVSDKETGLIVEQNWEAVLAGIKTLMDDKQYLKRLKENAKKMDCSRFLGDYMQFEGIFSDLV